MIALGRACRRRLAAIVAGVRHVVRGYLWARPALGMYVAGTGGDLLRGRAQLLAENALLRQQLLVLRRSVNRPVMTPADRALLAAGPADRPAGDAAAVAPRGLPVVLEMEVEVTPLTRTDYC